MATYFSGRPHPIILKPVAPHPLILNLLKDGRQDFQIPRDFPYRPPAILQQVQDERKEACWRGLRRHKAVPSGFPLTREGR